MDFALEAFIHHGAHNDVGIRIDNLVDHFRGGGHVLEGHVFAAADIDHTTLGTVDAGRFQQGAAHRRLSRLESAGAAGSHTDAEQGCAGASHHRSHVGEVNVH